MRAGECTERLEPNERESVDCVCKRRENRSNGNRFRLSNKYFTGTEFIKAK